MTGAEPPETDVDRSTDGTDESDMDDGTDGTDVTDGTDGTHLETRMADGPFNRAETAAAVAEAGASPVLTADRRSLLKTMALPPFAAALAGCGEDTVEISTYSDSPGGTDGTPGTGTSPAGERVAFGDTITFEGSYELSVTVGHGAGGRDADGEQNGDGDEGERRTPVTTVVGRVRDSAHYFRMERGDSVTESYLVDGDAFVVTGETCVRYPDVTAEMGGDSEPPDGATEAVESFPGLVETGTSTVDDRQVTVYELPAGSLPGQEQAMTYHVDAESGHIRRLETAMTTVEYRSWGDVPAIEAPDLDCETVER